MSDVLIIPPYSYAKKQLDQFHLKEYDKFIKAFELKLNDDWCYSYTILPKAESTKLYKASFDRFQKKVLSVEKPYLVIFIVVSKTDECFRKSVEKLIRTCEDEIQLKRILTISLDTENYSELNDSGIDLTYFGDYVWKLEDADQWDFFHKAVQSKLIQFRKEFSNSLVSDSVNIPNTTASVGRSPSKLKQFFHTLPAKFDKDHRMSLKRVFNPKSYQDQSNKDIPNIEIDKPNDDPATQNCKNTNSKPNSDSTKLSLNSLFKRRSKRKNHRDSGLSTGSSLSTDSRRSDANANKTNEGVFEMDDDDDIDATIKPTNSSKDESKKIKMATLQTSPRFKAKIVNFKTRTGRALTSTKAAALGCLQSPENSRKPNKKLDKALGEMVKFSTNIMAASSDVTRKNKSLTQNGIIRSSMDGIRGKSEPVDEMRIQNLTSMFSSIADPIYDETTDGRIKYYSWNSNLDNVSYGQQLECLSSPRSETLNSSMGIPSDKIDDNPDARIPIFSIEESETEKCLKSLEDMISSIEDSCVSYKVKPVQNSISEENKNPINETKIVKESKGKVHSGKELVTTRRNIRQNQTTPIEFIYKPMSMEFMGTNLLRDSHMRARSCSPTPSKRSRRRLTYTLLHHPASVTALMALTAYTAPNWSTYICSQASLEQLSILLYQSIQNLQQTSSSDVINVVQSLPNTIITGARQGTVHTLNKVISLMTQSNTFLMTNINAYL